ncbi:MAG: GNAT family N-acetyltransferase [Pirellulales bacterium]
MRIEVGTLQRLEAIARLFESYRVFYGQASDIARARQFLRERMAAGDSHILCAIDQDDSMIGFTQLYPCFSSVSTAPIWILNDLFVDPQARRSGVGQKLLAAARDHALATGAIRLELATARSNHTAQGLYESQGWIKEQEFFRYQLPVPR